MTTRAAPEQTSAAREQFMAEVRRIVDLAPAATPAQRAQVAAVLRPTT